MLRMAEKDASLSSLTSGHMWLVGVAVHLVPGSSETGTSSDKEVMFW